jgi:hypothetical protein
VQQPPGDDRCSHNHQPENLVAPIEAPLLSAPIVLGGLLQVRFYAAFNHIVLAAPGGESGISKSAVLFA